MKAFYRQVYEQRADAQFQRVPHPLSRGRNTLGVALRGVIKQLVGNLAINWLAICESQLPDKVVEQHKSLADINTLWTEMQAHPQLKNAVSSTAASDWADWYRKVLGLEIVAEFHDFMFSPRAAVLARNSIAQADKTAKATAAAAVPPPAQPKLSIEGARLRRQFSIAMQRGGMAPTVTKYVQMLERELATLQQRGNGAALPRSTSQSAAAAKVLSQEQKDRLARNRERALRLKAARMQRTATQ